MIPSVVKEASGLYTIKSTLYMQPTKADKDSVFQCTVEYSMPEGQIKQKKSDSTTINLNCEWTVREGGGVTLSNYLINEGLQPVVLQFPLDVLEELQEVHLN